MKKILALLIPLLVFSCQPAFAGLKAVVPLPNTVTSSGNFTSGNCVQFSSSGSSGATVSDAGSACGSGGGGTPGGSPNQVQYNNAGAFGGFTFSGDCTLVVGTGVITCTKTGGNAFAASATTDTTTTANITDSTNKRFVTDAQLVVIGNTSGTNTGDQVVPVNTTATSSNYFSAYNSTTGAFTKARPACADLSDSSTGCTTTVGSLATLNTVNNGNWSGTALAIGNGGTGQTTKTAAFDALQPMTTSGDVIYGGTSGTGTRLGANSTGTNKYLQSVSSGIPAWAQVAFGDLSGNATNAQLATQSANTVLGALTATTPSGLSLPSCTDTSGNHLNYTSGTGFSCGTSDAHVGTVTSIATTSPITGGTITSTGTIACATCATTTNGGALSGTAPIAVSAGGVISGGGLGTVTGALKGNGSGTITQAACADLSNGAASCSTDTTNAANISSGTIPGARLGAIGGTYLGDAVTGNQTIVLVQYAPYAFTINTLKNLGTVAGTVTGALKINGTNVTGCNALALTSTPAASTSCTAANVVAAGDLITFVTTSASSLTGLLAFSMIGTRS